MISRVALCTSVSLVTLMVSSTAFGQDTGTSETVADASAEEIVVTGSRVSTGNNSPTPVTVVATQQLQTTTPSNIPDALNKLPVFSGSSGQRSLNNSSSNSVGNYLNLRGIGANRSLILFDGHRFPATTQTGLIDTNAIPQMLIERVDIVTGGASAVYGSDAVSGVVNFIVNKNFNGLKYVAQAGVAERGDAPSQRLGLAGGMSVFGGRGHIEGSYEYYNSEGIQSQMKRPYGRRVYSEMGAGTAANPFHLVENTRQNVATFGGLINSGALAGQQFIAPGVLAPFVHGTPTGTVGGEAGGDGVYRDRALTASLESHQVFGRFDYELSDDIDFHVQAAGTKSKNFNIHGPLFFQNVRMASDNPYLPQSARDTLAAAGEETFLFSRYYRNSDAQTSRTSASVKSGTITAGLDGRLGGDLEWSAAYSFGASRQKVTSLGNIDNQKLFAALDAVRGPDGNIVCRVSVTNPGLYPGCVPLNPFGIGADNPAALAYVRTDTGYTLDTRLHDLSGSIAGTAFEGWAGPIKFAISGEYRHESFENTTTSNPSIFADCTGLRYNCGATTATAVYARTAPAKASQSVTEGAIEVDVPLLKDLPLVEALSVNGAARYTRYSTSGDAWTWKVGLDWHIMSDLRLRATRSRDIRAPTLNDLFAPVSRSLTGFTDIHTGVTDLVAQEARGNPNLKPEVAQTLTLGAVYKPSWLPGFSAAVDYYDIKISDAITTVGGNNQTTLAQCEQSNGTSPLCELYVRPLPFSDTSAANYPTLILTQGLNVASFKARGIDTEVNYGTDLGEGRLNLRMLATYTDKFTTVQFPGAVALEGAGAADGVPKWKLAGFLTYQQGGLTVDVQERWRSAVRQNSNPTLVFTDGKVPAIAYTDINLAYQIQDVPGEPQFFVNVQNVFDKQPPLFANTSQQYGFNYPVLPGDDVLGRYITIGVRGKF